MPDIRTLNTKGYITFLAFHVVEVRGFRISSGGLRLPFAMGGDLSPFALPLMVGQRMLLLHGGQGNAWGLGGCETAEAAMRPHEVLVVAPGDQDRSGMG